MTLTNNKLFKAALIAPLALLLYACAEDTAGPSGEELAAQYCTGCHLMPMPGQLPQETWPFVLKWMGNYLGFENKSGVLGEGIVNFDIVPKEKIISSGEFSKIKDYYLEQSKPQKEMFASDRREY